MSEFNRDNMGFADAVCIDAGRVYDSCMDRDCLENLRVFFNDAGQSAVQNAVSCRVKCASVADVKIDVEPVAFNRGFYSCDMTFYFIIKCEVATAPCSCAQDICGVAAYTKKVILCGSEGSVKTFSTQTTAGEDRRLPVGSNLPKCTVSCVDPVVLDSKICEVCRCDCCSIPSSVLAVATGGEISQNGSRALFVTLGLFSIVQLIRNVQMVVPVYDFCLPQKECTDTTESPCDLFGRIEFPTEEFFPPACAKRSCCCEDSRD